MPTVKDTILQSMVAFVALFLMARLMGKRQIAQLTFFDYVVGLVIGDIAASWSLEDIRSIPALSGLLVWASFALLLAWVHRKFYFARMILDGKPLLVIEHGNVMPEKLKKANLTLDELMLLLREKEIFKLSDVETAIFEINGTISVMKKAELQPITPKDIGIQVAVEPMPHLLIIDGRLLKESLAKARYTEDWLLAEIKKKGAKSFRDILVAQGECFY